MSENFVYNFVTTGLLAFVALVVVLYLIAKLTAGICKGNACLVGKTAIVTGGNAGIGYETVLGLAVRGARVIIADVADSTKSRLRVIEETGNQNVISMHLDLSENESIRQFAKDFKALPDVRLDILVNNAGIAQSDGKKNSDGIDFLMQVNYLGAFLLTHCLADILKRTAGARILFVTSILCFLENLTVANMVEPHQLYNYGKSKLCMLIASWYFTKRMKKYNVTSNCVYPGLCKTKIHLLQSEGSLLRMIHLIAVQLLGKTSFEGAQPVLDAATSSKWNNISDQFFLDCNRMIKPTKHYNRKFREEIIDKSKTLVDLKVEEEL